MVCETVLAVEIESMSGCKNIYNVIFVVNDMKYITLILEYGCNLSNE